MLVILPKSIDPLGLRRTHKNALALIEEIEKKYNQSVHSRELLNMHIIKNIILKRCGNQDT